MSHLTECKVVIFDGPQGSGKTSATKFLAQELGYSTGRGIPNGTELGANTLAQNWQATHELLNNCNHTYIAHAIDRCIWSLVMYETHYRARYADMLFRMGLSRFIMSTIGINYKLVLLDAEPEICYERQKKEKSLKEKSLYEWQSIDHVIAEVERYRQLFGRLLNEGINVHQINNTSTKQDYHEQLLRIIN